MITFNNIVERFEIFAENHFFIKTFSFGSPDDVDLSKFTSFPLMHLVYTGATYDAGTKTYNLEVYILDAPADKDGKVIRQKEVVSDAEQCAEDIIADIKNGGNIFLFAQDYEVVNATTTPLEEETKNVLSGVLLDLSVAIPYEWDACNAPIDGVTPEGGDEVSYARRGILRMVTQNGATDVLSVRTIKVSNGTLTDEGDGVVSLDTAGAESLDELTDVTITSLTPSQFLQYNGISGFWENETLYLATLADTKGTPTEGQLLKRTGGFWQPADIGLNDLEGVTITSPITGNVLQYSSALGWYNTNLPTPSPPPSTTDQLPEGTTNLYYTEARVSANSDVAANTAKVGITAQQAADILNNNAKVSLIAGGTTGQALVKTSGTDYDVEWADIAVDVQYHNRYQSESETLRAGGTETIELYYSAQADGDGLAESASSDTPAAGYDIRRKLYYSEAGFADPDTGTWTQFTAIADNTTFNNAKAALLAYLKERTGGTVPISLKMTWEEVAQAPAFTGLLNESYGSGAEAAYSTRRLNGNVTECMVIRRASDSTTTTIGFVDGNIDESAITTFCTGTTCTVYQWRDQSGNGNDATAAAPTNEPTIYTGGALVKEGGKVTLNFDGTDDFLNVSYSITAQPLYMFATSKLNYNGTQGSIIVGTPTFTNGLIYGRRQSTGNWILYAGTVLTSTSADNFRNLHSVYANGSNSFVYLNGGEILNGNAGTGYNIDHIGLSGTTDYQQGNTQEIILYNTDKSSVRTSIESNIGDYFTQNTPLLDTYSGAAAAYSLRLLDSTYTGALINVWNGTSYADIYPNVFGELDTVALAAHCGSNDGFIRYWYDQSSNGNTATQTTTASMPKIYDGTTGVVTENGRPIVLGSSGDWLRASTYTGNSSASVFSVIKRNYTANIIISYSGNPFALVSTQNSTNTTINSLMGTVSYYQDGTAASFTTRGDVYTETANQVAISFFGSTASYSLLDIGYPNTSATFPMYSMQELIIYNTDQSSNRTNIEDNINTFYSIF